MNLRTVLFLIYGSLALPLFANAEDHLSPEEVFITAAPIDNLLQPTQVLSGDELLIKSVSTIGETLANEPGISSSYFGPASSRPIIRGLSGSRVSILSNSSSTLDVSDVSPDHAVTVESVLADQVEIIRGPATLLYGSNASGGIVNVTDGRIPDALTDNSISGVLEVRADTASNQDSYIGRLDGGQDNLAWHFSGFDRQTDNIDIPGFATANPAERPGDQINGELKNSYSDTNGYNLGLSWIGPRGYLGASVSELDSTYGLPGPEEEEEGGEDEPVLFEGPFLDMKQTRFDLRGELTFEDSFIETGKFVLGVNDYQHNEIEPSGEIATTFDNDQLQARVEVQHALIGGFRGAAGLQVDQRELESVGEEAFIVATDTDAWGLFLFEEREADWGIFQFGARVESLEHDNDDFSGYDEEAFSFSAGVSVPVGKDDKLIFNLSRTERNPNAEELYSNGAHIATRQFEIGILANRAEADKEVSVNYEIGLQRETGGVTWEAWVYNYDIEDYIYQDLTGAEIDDLPVAIYRQDDAEFYGAEASVSFPLRQFGNFDNNLKLFADFVEAELSGGQDLPRIPPWRAGADFSFGQENWEAGVDIIYHGEQNDISSFETDDYTLVGANYLYRLDSADSTQWELFLRGDNLLDKEARKSTSFIAAYAPLPGISFTAGIRGRF